MKHFSIVLLLSLVSHWGWAQTVSTFIHVDQFGYASTAEKVAVLSNPIDGYNSSFSYTAPATLEVRDANSNAVVYSGPTTPWNNGQTHAQSGDQGWWFNFSAVTAPGTYYIIDTQNNEQTGEFTVGSSPYEAVLKHACRMFYYNRCNDSKAAPYAEGNWTDGMNFLNPLQDANCRYIYDPNDASLEKDLSGGWFDAGDYNKYVTFTYTTLHDLLAAYENNPMAFSDSWNIPESDNGLPDIIDEIKWELDWLIKMTNNDGRVHIKMGSQNYTQNFNSPPSSNTDPRFYGPTCTSASVTAASVYAHAAIVFDQFPSLQSYALVLQQNAINCFNYAATAHEQNALEENCDDGSIVSGDADVDAAGQLDRLISAAVYLYELTSNPAFDAFITSNYTDTELMQFNNWDAYDLQLAGALLRYTLHPSADAATANNIVASATTTVNNNYEGFFGFSDADLSRSFMPDYSYHWGSNSPKAGYGNMNLLLAAYNMGNAADLTHKATEQLHYFHGVNPLGLVHLSNMYDYGAERSVNELYHGWFANNSAFDHAQNSPYGPAPGYVTGGANQFYTVSSYAPPYGQPIQKSYLDFNDDFPANSYEITEPAIYYQASYIRLLSYFVTGQNTSTSIAEPTARPNLVLYPNPGNHQFALNGLSEPMNVSLVDLNGNQIKHWNGVQSNQKLAIADVAPGIYVVQCQTRNGQPIAALRFIKMNP